MWKQTAILIPVSEQINWSTGVKAPLWAPEIFETHYTFPILQMAQCLSLAQNPYETRHKTTSASRLKPAFPLYLTLLCTLLLLLSLKPTHQNHNILLTVCIVLPLLALKLGFPFTVIHLFVYVCRLHWVAILITCAAFCWIVNPTASDEGGGRGLQSFRE